MITTLDDFIREYTAIRDTGWIKTHRYGPTGIGKTLEDLLEIPENNDEAPDFGDYELKSGRKNSGSMLTLFTKSPMPRGANGELLKKFGYSSGAYDNDELVLHTTLSATKFTPIGTTGHSLKIGFDDEKLFIESEEGPENVYWRRDDLKKAFESKFKGKFVYAKAQFKGTGADEEFLYDEAYEISDFSYESLIEQLQEGHLYIDLRIGQYPDGRTHDHGTAFRIREEDEAKLFKNVNKIV